MALPLRVYNLRGVLLHYSSLQRLKKIVIVNRKPVVTPGIPTLNTFGNGYWLWLHGFFRYGFP